MMTGRRKNSNTFSVFKWKTHGESSLNAGLLEDVVPPEIELSGYGRTPSPGSESPSALLNGESLNAEPITDLDLFFERLYNYYCEKGIYCIIIKWVVELLSLGFTICFSGFFLLFVDWNGLRNAKCGMDAVESGIKPCDLSKEALHKHPLTPFTLSKAIILGYLAILSIYWIFCFLRFFAQLKDTLGIRNFYHNDLQVTDNEIQTMPWAAVLEKLVQLQSSQQLCVVKDLSAHDIVMRLMRKENYLIGMVNKGILSFPISSWVPGAGPTVSVGSDGIRYRLVLTKTLEWTLNWCVLQSMFDRNFCIRRDFIDNPTVLKKRLILVGLVMLLLSPFLVIFMLVYLFLRHAEQFYNHPSTASSRRWSNLSRWILREFNEVDHLFRHRINSSLVHASDYIKQFPSPIISVIAKFISFVSGGFAAILIIIAFLEESLLEGHIFGRNLFWYAAVFGTITAISRAAIVDELLVLDPEGTMSLVVQHTHYMPKRWRNKVHTERVRTEFETLFQYTGMMLLEEMASIFLTPYLLIFVVPQRVDEMLKFIADFTVDVEGVGHVCSFSVFDFQAHGNANYGAPIHTARYRRSSQGKMEKSFLSFHLSYPSWEPNGPGKQFLSTLRLFKEQKLRHYVTRNSYSPSAVWRENMTFRGQGNRGSDFSRDVPLNSPGFGPDLGGLWPIDAYQESHPYILDWYYTSVPRHHAIGAVREAPDVSIDVDAHDDVWALAGQGPEHGTFWGHEFEDRMRSHMGASTSTPFFRESVLQHNESDSGLTRQDARSQWWARTNSIPLKDQPQASFLEPPEYADTRRQPQASFLEPPDFSNPNPHHASNSYFDNSSEKSLEEQEQYLDWRNSHHSARATFMDEIEEEGGIQLHFDDVYSNPPFPTMNPGYTSDSNDPPDPATNQSQSLDAARVWNKSF
uniref:Autophagy-related protein 9 n=1 Tax=Kalanchoe fedtschenkoi TaxID=63787 RepID=A0A7N1A131_KALFE